MPCVGVNVWMQHCLIPFSFYIHIYYGAYLSVVVVVVFLLLLFFCLKSGFVLRVIFIILFLISVMLFGTVC